MAQQPDWLKSKGYLHITPTLNLKTNWKRYMHQIQSPKYVAQYGFYPLLHRIKKERRYKKVPHTKNGKTQRSHRYRDPETGTIKPTAKNRPLHYAAHFDALIYGYYAQLLRELYEQQLHKDEALNQAVSAYRSIPVSATDPSGKSNIHFAKEAFDEINKRVRHKGQTGVLTLDLKSFFSTLSHTYLYRCWADLLDREKLPPDHFNVFKSCTDFSYILMDDLRTGNNGGFDEKKLAQIRKKKGYRCFFASNKDFRKAIKEGRLPIYKNPFRNAAKEPEGIPQGLPISAVLANLYLLEFDREMVANLVKKEGVFYRRYSDDILICCRMDQMEKIYNYIARRIKKYHVKLSKEKTERFLFKKMPYNKKKEQCITSVQLYPGKKCVIGAPLTYLGFEFRGFNTLIKSANLASYYRRLIYIVKSRAKRAKRLAQQNPTVPKAVYMNQVKKLYNAPLQYSHKKEQHQVFRSRYNLVVNDRGEFEFDHYDIEGQNANYISYIRRCDKVFETKAFSRQLRRKHKIIGQAIRRHLNEQ